MLSHLLALAAVQAVRCAIGLALGAFLVFRSFRLPYERLSRLEPGDRAVFLVAGIAFMVLALLRGLQAGWTLLAVHSHRRAGVGTEPAGGSGGRRRALRRLGLALAIVDLVDLTGFPITTACGTYGILVLRHPDVLDFLEGKFSEPAGAPRLATGA